MRLVGYRPLKCPRCGAQGHHQHYMGEAGEADKCTVCLFTSLNFNKGSGTAGNTTRQFTPIVLKDLERSNIRERPRFKKEEKEDASSPSSSD